MNLLCYGSISLHLIWSCKYLRGGSIRSIGRPFRKSKSSYIPFQSNTRSCCTFPSNMILCRKGLNFTSSCRPFQSFRRLCLQCLNIVLMYISQFLNKCLLFPVSGRNVVMQRYVTICCF